MNNEQKKQLNRMQFDFVQGLQDIERITDYLLSHEIFSRAQAETILASGPLVEDKVRTFLNVLVRCSSPNVYNTFVSALRETNQSSFAETLAALKTDSHVLDSLSFRTETPIVATPMKSVATYPISSNPRGYVLLVNIFKFNEGSELSDRDGSDKDVSALHNLFTNLNYFVIVLLNPTARILRSSLNNFKNSPNHNKVDAGGLIVMSHGSHNSIYTADGMPFAIDDILNVFTNESLPALAGKPKFILFQACRGEEKDRGYSFEPDTSSFATSAMESVDATSRQTSWNCLPCMSDYIISYSTLPGFVSWRSEKEGSWFVQVLVDVFRQFADFLHVLELLTEVNRRLVEESQDREFKQIPQQLHTLTRRFYLAGAPS